MFSLFKNHWRWLLIFSCLPLLATKALFNLPIAIMMVLGLIAVIKAPVQVFRDRSVKWLTVIFLAYEIPLLLSLPDAVNLERSLSTALLQWRFFFAGIFVLSVMRDPAARQNLFIATGLFGVFISLDVLIQIVMGWNLLGYPYETRAMGIFYPKPVMGIVLAVILPVVFELMRVRAKHNWLWYLLIPLVVLVVIVSGNRNAWLSLIIVTLLYLPYLYFVTDKRQLTKLLSVGVVFGIVAAIVAIQGDYMQGRVNQTLGVFSGDQESIDKATGLRLDLWKTAWNMYLANPVNGVGPRGYRYAYLDHADNEDVWVQRMDPDTQNHPQSHPHQMFLEFAAETGSIGLIGLLIMAVLYFRLSKTAMLADKLAAFPWVVAVAVAWFPGNAHMAFYGSYWGTVAWWVMLVSIGVSGAVSARKG